MVVFTSLNHRIGIYINSMMFMIVFKNNILLSTLGTIDKLADLLKSIAINNHMSKFIAIGEDCNHE